MSPSAIPFLADDILWAEVPILVWLVVAIVVMLINVWRFGWGGARHVLARFRVQWGASLVLAIAAAIAFGAVSGQPLPAYL